jgi:hypothetical protein
MSSSGTRNSIGDFLRSIFSTLVNKDDEVFKALFANPEETGAVETIFNELETVRDEWCNNSDVYNQAGEMLEKTLSYFSVLDRLFEESDTSYKDRNALLFYRNGDTLWGDKWDILGIFKKYFNTDKVFIVNDTNPINENLFLDGDFEDGNAWILENCVYDKSAGFSGMTGILFNTHGSCRQDVEIDNDSTYFIHFFLDGHIGVKIKDNYNRYWDIGRGEFGEWVNNEAVNNFSTNQWDAVHMFFLTSDHMNKVTVSFVGIDDSIAMLDYARLFRKGNYSSFTLIANFTGLYTADTMSMAPGDGDPVRGRDYSHYGHFSNDMYLDEEKALAPGEEDSADDGANVNYDLMSYIEQTNLFGNDTVRPELVYTELLEIVKAGGISSYIELLIKED